VAPPLLNRQGSSILQSEFEIFILMGIPPAEATPKGMWKHIQQVSSMGRDPVKCLKRDLVPGEGEVPGYIA
jgi:hypothetical protein